MGLHRMRVRTGPLGPSHLAVSPEERAAARSFRLLFCLGFAPFVLDVFSQQTKDLAHHPAERLLSYMNFLLLPPSFHLLPSSGSPARSNSSCSPRNATKTKERNSEFTNSPPSFGLPSKYTLFSPSIVVDTLFPRNFDLGRSSPRMATWFAGEM